MKKSASVVHWQIAASSSFIEVSSKMRAQSPRVILSRLSQTSGNESPFVSSGMAARKVGWSQETNTSVPLVANCALTNIGGYRRRITRGAVLHSVVYIVLGGSASS